MSTPTPPKTGFSTKGFSDIGFTNNNPRGHILSDFEFELSKRFTDAGYSADGFTHGTPAIKRADWLPIYYTPIRAKFEIFDKNGFNLLGSYDSFLSDLTANSFHLEYLDCEPSVGNNSTGTWSCIIEDSKQLLDRKKIGMSNRVLISAGRTQDQYIPIMHGVCRFDQPDTSDYDSLRLFMSGFGTQYITNERLINYQKIAKRNDLLSADPYRFDPQMTAAQIVKTLLQSENVLASNAGGQRFDTIQEIGQYSVVSSDESASGSIHSNVNNFLPGISYPYIYASDAFDDVANTVGAEWGVDAYDRFYLRYPSSQTNNDIITIKSGIDYDRDRADLTSYIQKGSTMQVGRTMRKEDGFANRLFALAGGSSESLASGSNNANNGFTPLTNTAIAQQVKADSTQFRDISFLLSKSANFEAGGLMPGRIVADNNGTPTGPTIVSFDIFTDDIPLDQPGPVYRMRRFLSGKIITDKLYWIILLGLPEFPSKAEARWHHDGQTGDFTKTVSSATRPAEPFRPPPDERESSWEVSTTGPTYNYAAFNSQKHIVVASDPFSINRWGEVDNVISPSSSLSDTKTTLQYLYSLLVFSAKPKLIYPTLTVSIPIVGFTPGQLVQIIDEKSGLTAHVNRLAELISARYVWDARGQSQGNSSAVGINTADITLLGYYDYTKEEATELI